MCNAGVAEQADARDLKSRDAKASYRFDPGHRHHLSDRGKKYRGVEQLVARRAHNPEAAGSSPTPATKEKNTVHRMVFFSLNTEGIVPHG